MVVVRFTGAHNPSNTTRKKGFHSLQRNRGKATVCKAILTPNPNPAVSSCLKAEWPKSLPQIPVWLDAEPRASSDVQLTVLLLTLRTHSVCINKQNPRVCNPSDINLSVTENYRTNP